MVRVHQHTKFFWLIPHLRSQKSKFVLFQNATKMRKINGPWPKYDQFQRWSSSVSNSRPFLQAAYQILGHSSYLFKENPWKPQIWSVSLSQNDAKIMKINRSEPVLKAILQHAKFQVIPPMRFHENVLKSQIRLASKSKCCKNEEIQQKMTKI